MKMYNFKEKFNSFVQYTYILEYSLLALIIAGFFIYLNVVPPMSNPDETWHLERAYILGKSNFILKTLPDGSQGGYVDSGLIDYIFLSPQVAIEQDPANRNSILPVFDRHRENANYIDTRKYLHFTHKLEWQQLDGVQWLCPLVYIPQAAGLIIGDYFNLTIEHSYKLSKFIYFISCLILLICAYRIWPFPAVIVSMLCLPIVLFQLYSLTIDALCLSIAIFIISYLFYISYNSLKVSFSSFLFALILLFVATSAKPFLAPLYLIMAYGVYKLNNIKYYISYLVNVLLYLLWEVWSLTTTNDFRVPVSTFAQHNFSYYIIHISEYISILSRTLKASYLNRFYFDSFFGIIGQLDARLYDLNIYIISVIFFITLILSINYKYITNNKILRIIYFIAGILSFYIIFLALLVTATPASAWHIEGIQGRYFTYPLLFISYSLGYKNTSSDSKTRFTCLLLVFVFLITSIASSMDALIQRYYVQLPEWMEKSKTLSISKMTMWSNYSKQVKTKSLLYNNSLAYNNIGKLLFETGNYDEAENMILHAIELRPFYSNAYTNLTLLYLKTSRYDKALVTGLKAVKLENTPENQLNLADAYRYLHRYNDSIKYYNGALNLRNNYFEALVSLANTYLLIKDTANAAIYLNKSYQITTGYSMFYLVCSKYYICNNNKLEALKFAQTSVELDSNSDECHLNLGQLYYDSRNYKDAITELSRAINLNKYNIDALDTLGNLYLNISQFSLAAELYSRALMINNIDMVAIQGLKNCNLSK